MRLARLINLSVELAKALSLILCRRPIRIPVNSRSKRFTFSEKESDGSMADSSWNSLVIDVELNIRKEDILVLTGCFTEKYQN